MTSEASSEDKGIKSQSQLRGELKDELETWVRHRFYVIVTIGAIAGFFGVKAVVRDQVTDLVDGELARATEAIANMQQQMSQATNDAGEAADRAEQEAKRAEQEIARMRERMNLAIDEADRAAKGASMAAKTARAEVADAVADAALASQTARSAAMQARQALATAEKVQEQFNAERAVPVLSENDRSALRIRQTVERLPKLASDQKTWRLVTFSLEIDTATADSAESELLARVERVDYNFDERWFAEPVKSVTSVASRFSHSIRVFGPTKVRAVIYLKDPPTTVEREGLMNIFNGGYLGEG